MAARRDSARDAARIVAAGRAAGEPGYLERVIPGAPVFARILPVAAMVGGLALACGFWTRIAAAVSLVVVLSLQLGAGAMFRYTYLMDASGLPLVGGLLALVIGGETRRVRKPGPAPRT